MPTLCQPIHRMNVNLGQSVVDKYGARLVGAEIDLYKKRNALNPYDPAQLQERMAAEHLLNTKLLSRWEEARPAHAESLSESVRSFLQVCARAENSQSTHCSVVVNMPCDIHGHHRRFPDNLATNDRLVDTLGRVATETYDPSTFCNTVLTHPIGEAPAGSAGVIQIQGCETSSGADGLLQMATAYAASVRAKRVLFVNVAGTQIPTYFALSRWASSNVPTMVSTPTLVSGYTQASLGHPEEVQTNNIDGLYVEYTAWPDGLIIPPNILQNLAQEVVYIMKQEPATLLVVGCNAGKDRSGLVNALVQLELLWQKTGVPDALAPDVLQVVANIQQARPEALRTLERFKLLFLAAELVARRIEAHHKAPSTYSGRRNERVTMADSRRATYKEQFA